MYAGVHRAALHKALRGPSFYWVVFKYKTKNKILTWTVCMDIWTPSRLHTKKINLEKKKRHYCKSPYKLHSLYLFLDSYLGIKSNVIRKRCLYWFGVLSAVLIYIISKFTFTSEICFEFKSSLRDTTDKCHYFRCMWCIPTTKYIYRSFLCN